MVIDRIENGIAVIEDGDKMFELSTAALPDGAKEGSVLIYQEEKYIIDKASESTMKKSMKEMEKKLIKKNK